MARAIVVCGSILFLFLCCGTDAPAAANSEGPPPAGGNSKLIEMLQDPLLWGPDYPEAINAIPGYAQAGEQKVEIQRHRVVGRKKYTNLPAAEKDAKRAREGMKTAPRMAMPGKGESQGKKPAIEAVVLPEDRAAHVGTPERATVQYVAQDVSIDRVMERFGKPERVTVEVIDDGTERRPIELTLYHYADGTLIVGTTDVNANPRAVDRVIVDANAVTKAVF